MNPSPKRRTFSRAPHTILLLFILSACTFSGAQTPPPPLPTPTLSIYVTVPPDATATPTPFRPLDYTESPQPSLTPFPSTPAIAGTQLFPTATNSYDDLLPGAWTPPIFNAPPGVPTPMPLLTDTETVTFLLLGSDQRLGTGFRTDTIVLAAIRPKLGQVTLISIPRDLWVYIPGWEMQRINTAYVHGISVNYPGGGPGLLKDTILYNLGIRIDHTAIVDFDGFRRIVDTLEGIDVPVYCSYTDWRLKSPGLNPDIEANWELYTVEQGLVHMDGDFSLWYARSRLKSSDYDRGRRQQEVLRAIYAKGLRIDVIGKIPQLYNDFSSTVQTDIGLGTLLELSPLALHLTNADIRSYYLSPPLVSAWTTSGGAWVALPDGPAIQSMLLEALSPSRKTPEMESIIVEVWNGFQSEGWDTLAAERLNYAGYETRIAPADRRDYAYTLLYDVTAAQDPNRAASLLAILGLPPSALVAAPGYRNDVSYVLIVGADYQPCFKPQNMAP